jgi:hypothetical protein
MILRKPAAWTPVAQTAANHEVDDDDFASLLHSMMERRKSLEYCLDYLKHAHRSYADVKDMSFMKGLMSQLSGATRKKLNHGSTMLTEVIREVMALLQEHQQETQRLANAIQKVAVLDKDRRRKDEVIEGYSRLVAQMHREFVRLQTENQDLRKLETENQQVREALAKAMLCASLYKTTVLGGPMLLGDGNSHARPMTPAESRAYGEAYLDLCIAVSAGAILSPDEINRSRESGVTVPDADEIAEIIDSIGVPLGGSMDEVTRQYRARVAEVHPDRHRDASPPIQKMYKQQYDRLQLAKSLHERYGKITG